MSDHKKIATDGGNGLGQNPFGALTAAGLPQMNTGSAKPETGKPDSGAIRSPVSGVPNQKNRGRVEIRRETGGRGGKTVTTVSGFVGIGLPEKETLCKKMRGACGCGGTVKDGVIEIQGDQREKIAAILTDAGFRPVFAGG
ncbi:MAG: translation initiation factor [Verrucomicrobia bacterium]|nr:translation initiation factor [Verrucomicrobiota bacterium]